MGTRPRRSLITISALVRLTVAVLAAVLVVSLFLITASPVFGDELEDASRLYFPWIPSGAFLSNHDGSSASGPYYGSITVHNLENEEIVLYYQATTEGSFELLGDFQSTLVGAYGARTFTPQQLQISEGVDGSGAVFVARKSSNTSVPARISGVQKQAAAIPIDVDAETHGGHLTVGGYTGLRPSDIFDDFTLYLPIVQTNNNWNSVIRATSFHLQAQQEIELTLREAGGGGVQQFSQNAEPGVPISFDLLDLGVDPGWVGSATLTGEAAFGAIAERFKNETNMLIMNSARPIAAANSVAYLPLVLRDWFDWNTGISLMNPMAVQVNATVSFYAMDGELVDSQVVVLPPFSMDFVYMPAGDGEPFVGSARVGTEGLVLGVIDEVKYLGDPAAGAGHAMSYMLEADIAFSGQQLSFPLYQKGDPNTGGGNTSGVQLYNPSIFSATYSYSFFDQFGNNMIPIPAGPLPTLGPGESATIYAMDIAQLPDGFTGSMIVSVHAGGLTAVSNNVNYDVQHDGSASFNMMKIIAPDDPDPPNGFITP